MDHWWNFKSDEERIAWIRSVIQNVKGRHELELDHAEIAKHSPLGEVCYLNNELSKLISEGLKYGGMVASWIKDDCGKIRNIENTILGVMRKSHDIINDDFRSFDGQLHDLLFVYFQWEILSSLLTKAKKKNDPGNLKQMFNPAINQQWETNFDRLFNLGLSSNKTWNKSEFAAVCHYVFYSMNVTGKHYVEESDFSLFKTEMAKYFGRTIPSADQNKALVYWEKMPPAKKIQISELFK